MRIARIVLTIYISWIAMLAVHELGHILHARFSGGRVIQVSFPPLGFSQTFVDPNPHPLIVAWGGPVWGVCLPALVVLVMRLSLRRVPVLLWFFTGFCLIANGAYIGLGWMKRSGDAHDLVRDGAPLYTLILFGLISFTSGLLCWHQIPSERWRMG